MTEVTIQRLGHHGDGIAEGPIYVPLSLPTEVVRGEIVDGRMAAPSIITPSADRVKAPCPHFKSCGGCSLMHGSDTFVAGWKENVIRQALDAHGLEGPLRPIHTSPPRSRRRATLAGTRTKKGSSIGFFGRRSDTIVPIRDCFVLSPVILETLPVLHNITRVGASRSAVLALSLTVTDGGIDLSVTGGKPLDAGLRVKLSELAQNGIARLSWGDELVFSEGRLGLSIGPSRVTPPPGAFLQATLDGEVALQNAVCEAIGRQARGIADLFSGLGTFTLPLAQSAPVLAVESAKDLLDALTHAAHHTPGLKRITTEARDLFRRPLLPDELAPFDAIVIDPPRAGAEAQCHELAKAKVPIIAMVSCNPITFARDAAILTRAGYRIDWIQPVDQFRWSPHVELAARLTLGHIEG